MRHFLGFLLCVLIGFVLLKAIFDFVVTLTEIITDKKEEDDKK
jgi:hypothetical protein